jgi:hypothetical protein
MRQFQCLGAALQTKGRFIGIIQADLSGGKDPSGSSINHHLVPPTASLSSIQPADLLATMLAKAWSPTSFTKGMPWQQSTQVGTMTVFMEVLRPLLSYSNSLKARPQAIRLHRWELGAP